mmetsp:Transcript_24971/g.34731  ORF Transcript_24971/g.34731 Transcript_24971/m.34731 type:complete len:94 (-) Transcript_24971:839-1120(-)
MEPQPGSEPRKLHKHNFRGVQGGLSTVINKYGEQNSAEAVRKREEEEIKSMDGEFSLPKGRPREDFEYSTAGAEQVTSSTPLSRSVSSPIRRK